MSYYKTIEGVKYDKALLEKAESLTKGAGDGRISLEDARNLTQETLDGNKVTEIERRTLNYIRRNFKLSEEASHEVSYFLVNLPPSIELDTTLIDAAELAVSGKGDGRISLDDAKLIYKVADGDGIISEKERHTLEFILRYYNCTDTAREFLLEKLS